MHNRISGNIKKQLLCSEQKKKKLIKYWESLCVCGCSYFLSSSIVRFVPLKILILFWIPSDFSGFGLFDSPLNENTLWISMLIFDCLSSKFFAGAFVADGDLVVEPNTSTSGLFWADCFDGFGDLAAIRAGASQPPVVGGADDAAGGQIVVLGAGAGGDISGIGIKIPLNLTADGEN